MPGRTLTQSEIYETIVATVEAIQSYHLACFLIGSAACRIHGLTSRVPNDIDMVVLSNIDREEIKRLLTGANDKFFLLPSTNPRNTYRILYYSLSPSQSLLRSRRTHACKVDILSPGILSIPDIPESQISTFMDESHNEYPTSPFLILLLLKLRGWEDHNDAPQAHYRAKKPIDQADIMELLQIAKSRKIYLNSEKSGWVPHELLDDSNDRLKRFARDVPESKSYWERIGFSSYIRDEYYYY